MRTTTNSWVELLIECSVLTGTALIDSIGKSRPEPTGVWTEKRLFPGGYSSTLRQMMDIFEEPGFSLIDLENLRLHYALTLNHWLKRYETHIE